MVLSKLKTLHNMQAVRKFTDRKVARDSFSRALDNYLTGQTPLWVLMYYGVGGIGKTTLLKHIKSEIEPAAKEKNKNLTIVEINLESAQFDSPDACLFAIYNQLKMSCPAFEYALAQLWSLQGWSIQDIKRQIINSDSLLFELVELAVNAAGIFAPVRLFYRLLETGSRHVTRWWGESKALVQEIGRLSKAELEERLPYYLGLAVEKAAVSHDKRFVFLLDSHETILHREAFETTKRVGDEWLQEFIGSAENGLYIMTGREYLKWADQNPDWKDYIEQHILGALTDEDADYFLSAIPIPEIEIRQAIIGTAHGVPLYLDLCASTYLIRKQTGETVNGNDFRMAEKDVIRRFISHLNRDQAEALKACALVERFDRELFLAFTQGLNISFPITQYHEFCNTSYTVQIDTAADTYKIHDTVRGFIGDEATLDTAVRLVTIILTHCFGAFSVASAVRISWVYPQAFTLLAQYPIQLRPAQIEQLVAVGLRLIDAGYWKRVGTTLQALLAGAPDREWPAGILFLQALSLRKQGALHESRAIYAGLLNRAEELGHWMPLVRFYAAHTTHLTGGYLDALAQYKSLTRLQGQDAAAVGARQLAYRQIADLQMLRGQFVDALQAFGSLTTIEDNPLWLADLHRFRGHVNRFNFNLVTAEEHYQRVLDLSAAVQAEAMRGKALTNLAETLCWTVPHTAIAHAAKAIEINQQVNAPIEVGKAMTAQAIALTASTGRAAEALSIARQAAALQEQNGYRSGVLFALQAQGLAQFVQGNHNDARAALTQMQQLSQEIGGMYAYIPMFLSLLLASESLDDFAQRFQWLDFMRTSQNAKAIANNFLKVMS